MEAREEGQRKTDLKRGYGADSARGAPRVLVPRQTLEAVQVVGWAVGEQERRGTRTGQVLMRLGVVMEGMGMGGLMVVGGILMTLVVLVGKEGKGEGRTIDGTDGRAEYLLMWQLADGGCEVWRSFSEVLLAFQRGISCLPRVYIWRPFDCSRRRCHIISMRSGDQFRLKVGSF